MELVKPLQCALPGKAVGCRYIPFTVAVNTMYEKKLLYYAVLHFMDSYEERFGASALSHWSARGVQI